VAFDDALAKGESEPGPLPRRLRREEGLEDPRPTFRGYPQDHALAVPIDGARDREPARQWRLSHGLMGVRYEVDENLV
jgi:hypothetical protein